MTETSPTAAPRERGIAAALLALGAVTVALVYLAGERAQPAGFDETWLLGVPRASADRLGWMLETTRGELRRPLFWAVASIAADAGGVHAAAAILHGAVFAAFAFLGSRVLAGRSGRPTIAALVAATAFAAAWALSPARVEAVADGTALGAPLGGLFLCLSATVWCHAQTTSTRPHATTLVATVLFAVALLADPAVCFAPVAFMALRTWVRRDDPEPRPQAGGSLAWMGLAAALALVASLAIREPGGGAPLVPTLLAAGSAIVRPLRAVLWPFGLHPAYDPPPGFPGEISPALVIDAVTAAAIGTACVVGARRATGWGLALVAYLALVAGPVLLRRAPTGGDVDGYEATMPVFLGAAAAAAGLPRLARTVATTSALALAAACGVLSHAALGAWTDEAGLAKHVIDLDPANERAHVTMGDAARRAGAPVADLVHWYGAGHDDDGWRPFAHARLGAVLLETGDSAGARRHLERSVAIAPWIAAARFDLGALELREGHLLAAQTHLAAAARLDTESADAWRLLAQTLDAAGDRAAAVDAITRAANLRPDDPGIAEELRRLAK